VPARRHHDHEQVEPPAPGGVLILGCGQVGAVAGDRLHRAGARVLGLRRRRAGPATAFPLCIGDAADAALHDALRRRYDDFATILITANPGFRGGGDNRVADAVLVAAARWPRARLVLCSSTAVYADAGGRFVDEDGALARDARACALLAIEAAAMRAGAVILRAGALGGLRRARRSRRQRAGGVLLVRGSSLRRLSWVHESDLAELLCRAAAGRLGDGIFNACAPLHPSIASFHRRWAVALGHRISVLGDERFQPDRLVRSSRAELADFPWRLDWSQL